MKELRRNMRFVGAVLVVLFVGLAGWFAMTVFTQGTIWASDVRNTRLSASNSLRGDITDRDGYLLAHTDEDGTRQYHANTAARLALSQTVGDTAGMSGTGIETFYSATLLDISTSLLDRLSELFNSARHVGSSVQITVDGPLQTYIAGEFPAGYRGAVCVINYRTGEILAMVSLPAYDPNALTGRSEAEVEDTAYLNRCLQGLYTPGSVFKIITLASALSNDPNVTGQNFSCSGEWQYEGGHIVCAGGTAHGTLDLKHAFKRSCNVTFGKLAYQLGLERLRATAERFGFNENFKFGDFVVYNSAFPESVGNMNGLVWAGIGQGEVLVTPLHMAMISGAIANNGTMMKPWLIKRIANSLGATASTGAPQAYRQVLSESAASVIAGYMYETVQSGTATRAAVKGYTVCGKTGSAEVSDDKTVETNAWFTGFVYDEAHPYAISVVIEGGGAGARMPSELASKALKKTIEYVG
ncbi:MAG: penicillin-binding transpeptidase domain-containing protein [Clostridia bacterium]|nr:penicillin-binding transpeptidase domain-containing protein [Clostridia bacterium]